MSYDPDPRAQGGASSQQQHEFPELNAELNQAKEVVQKNMTFVQDRGAHVDDLNTKVDKVRDGADIFNNGAVKMRKKMWWKNQKARACLIAAIIIAILIIVIVPIVVSKKS